MNNEEPNDTPPGGPESPADGGLDFICWNREEMLTGIDQIDQEHQAVIRDINRLCRAHRAGVEQKDIKVILRALCHFVQVHFQHEDAILVARQCPTRDEHRPTCGTVCAANRRRLTFLHYAA